MKKHLIIYILFIIVLTGCSIKNKNDSIMNKSSEYARLFNIIENPSDTILEIKENIYNNSNEYNSYKLTKDINPEKSEKKIPTIKIPLKRVICMSTGHIAYLNILNETESIVAVSGGRYINNVIINELIEQGKIADIGFESSLNYELILSLKPDMVFTYGISGENNSYIEKLRQLGIPVLVLGDFSENHPLGKLEYIKLFGALFGKLKMADSIFCSKKESYVELRDKLRKVNTRPNVLLNAPWKETWYLPGSDSYMTQLIYDAGASVLGAKPNTSQSGSSNIEEVYKLSITADFWLNPNSYKSINSLTLAVPLFKNINAIKRGNIYNNIKKITSSGGSDFWENGVIEPEIILMDLVKIFHPEQIENHELRYYIKLNID